MLATMSIYCSINIRVVAIIFKFVHCLYGKLSVVQKNCDKTSVYQSHMFALLCADTLERPT